MTPGELARVAALGTNGWLSTDHVSWVVNHLNSLKHDIICVCPNIVVNITQTMERHARSFNIDKVKAAFFVINVGMNNDGTTFMGSWSSAGSHWVVVYAEFQPKQLLYCDSSAWKAPQGLVDMVNSYKQHLPGVSTFDQGDLQLAHVPSPRNTGRPHICSIQCRNYPLLTCSDICGVISLIIPSLALLDRPVFDFMIGPRTINTIYLQTPSQYTYFLRRVLMTWFAEEQVKTDLVSPRNFTRVQYIFNHDHTFASQENNSDKKNT